MKVIWAGKVCGIECEIRKWDIHGDGSPEFSCWHLDYSLYLTELEPVRTVVALLNSGQYTCVDVDEFCREILG